LYESPEGREGWFLTEPPEVALPYEVIVAREVNSGIFSAVPGLLTAAGLTLTFISILLALLGVQYDKANTAEPIRGIDGLINGLSGKFVSSVVALFLSIVFMVFERFGMHSLRKSYKEVVESVAGVIPIISPTRILLDIQRSSANQAVSVSQISADVVDKFVGAFNATVVPNLARGMSGGVAESLRTEFRPTMEAMVGTLESLKAVIAGLESQKQESVSTEIKGLIGSLESSIVGALSRMGDSFHSALSGAATQEFGNVQGTLESTRELLAGMNRQFGSLQAAFGTIVERAEQSTTDQLKMGKEQVEALTALMNGLMVRMQESADDNLNTMRYQLSVVVKDLTDKIGGVSSEMMRAAQTATTQSQESAERVAARTEQWTETTAGQLQALLEQMGERLESIAEAANALKAARQTVLDTITQNAAALGRMQEASKSVQAYSQALAGAGQKLGETVEQQRQISSHIQQSSVSLRESFSGQNQLLSEYRRVFDDCRKVIDELDSGLPRILDSLNKGQRDYNQSVENNFKALVSISNEMIPQVSHALTDQIDNLVEPLEELREALDRTLGKQNGRSSK
jgi:ABC-type transporter Mla subunit MlaD